MRGGGGRAALLGELLGRGGLGTGRQRLRFGPWSARSVVALGGRRRRRGPFLGFRLRQRGRRGPPARPSSAPPGRARPAPTPPRLSRPPRPARPGRAEALARLGVDELTASSSLVSAASAAPRSASASASPARAEAAASSARSASDSDARPRGRARARAQRALQARPAARRARMWPPRASRASAAVALWVAIAWRRTPAAASPSRWQPRGRPTLRPFRRRRCCCCFGAAAGATVTVEAAGAAGGGGGALFVVAVVAVVVGEQLLRSRSRQHSSLAWRASPRRPSRSGGASLAAPPAGAVAAEQFAEAAALVARGCG